MASTAYQGGASRARDNRARGFGLLGRSAIAIRPASLSALIFVFLIFSVSAARATTNVALASNGGVASASSTYSSGYAPSGAIDGERSGANWGNGGGWNDGTPNSFPDWLQVNFNGSKSIDHVVVYSVQDNYTSPVEPTDTMTFSLYGLVDFTVQGWDGASWITLATVNGNNLIKRTVTFSTYTTDRIRINVTNAVDGWSRITEVEAWTAGAGATIEYLYDPSGNLTGVTRR